MRINDWYTSTVGRVSKSMVSAYQDHTKVDLTEEYRKYLKNSERVDQAFSLSIVLLVFTLVLPFLLVYVTEVTGLVDDRWRQIMIAVIISGVTFIGSMACLLKMSSGAAKARDASHSILEQFKRDVMALYYDIPGRCGRLDPFSVEENLISMAKDVVNAEKAKSRYLLEKSNRIKNALIAQKKFGLNYTRGEIFRRVSKR